MPCALMTIRLFSRSAVTSMRGLFSADEVWIGFMLSIRTQ